MHEAYDFKAVQDKWLPIWDKLAPFKSGKDDDERPKKYVLDMFLTHQVIYTWDMLRLMH